MKKRKEKKKDLKTRPAGATFIEMHLARAPPAPPASLPRKSMPEEHTPKKKLLEPKPVQARALACRTPSCKEAKGAEKQ